MYVQYLQVLINGREVDSFDSRDPNHVTNLTLTSDESQLDILVDNMGRVNYADYESPLLNEQRKGIMDVKTLPQ